jgi:ABC-type uncharacterized transport system YnjBCD substrate-binding protein
MSITPGRLDVKIPQGTTWRLSLTWTDSLGVAVNLTGYSAAAKFKKAEDNAEMMSLVSPTDITLGGAAGTIVLVAGPAKTAAVIDDGVWDLKLTAGDGTVTRLVEGKVLPDLAVT